TICQAEFERGESQERAETAYWRRRVVESCIYGVDLNPLAVELSKLSLWLTCIASAAPLSFLDHHLRCGNSLIGARLTDLGGLPEKKKKKTAAEQMSLNFGPDLKRAISEAISGIRQIEGTASGTVSEVKDKEKRWMEQVLPVLVPYRAIADLWTRTFFGEPLSEEDYLARAQRILDACRKDPGCVKDGGMRYHIKELEKPFFHWELEFPEVFFNGDGSLRENPGFDAVIGNPPYVRPHKIALVDKEWLWRAFEGYKAKTDLLNCFLEQAVRLCAETRYVSMITSDTWRTLESSVDFRALLLDRARVMQIVLLPCGVFIDVAVRPVVVVLRKDRDFQARNGNIVSVRQLESIASAGTCSQSVWMDDPRHIFDVARQSVSTIRTKITGTSELLGDIVTVDFGLKTGDDEKFVGAKRESSEYKKLVSSRSIGRYCLDWEGQWVWYRPDLMRANKGTARPGETARFERDKVVLSRMADGIEAALDREEYYVKDALLLADARNGYSEAYILALLNSYLLRFWYLSTFTTIDMHRNVAMRLPIRRIAFTTPDAERKRCAKKALQTYDRGLENGDACPILAFAEEHLEASRADVIHDLLAFLAERMTAMNTEKHAAAKGFLTDLKDFRGVDAHSLTPKTRLDAFWKLEAGDVFAHLNANRKALAARGTRLNASDEESIRARFQKAKAAIVPLETQIAFTDRLIDQIVYRLYSLTPEEIGIVEGGT
ncbi:MAG: TaqI-like C-terminal specificity domain-containing protein, partial [bacterium]